MEKIKSKVFPEVCVGLLTCWLSECDSVRESSRNEGVTFILTWKLKFPSIIVLFNVIEIRRSLRSFINYI